MFLQSKIVLPCICCEARKFQPFGPVRVGEIQTNTNPSQWRHIPGEMNVADDVWYFSPKVDRNLEAWTSVPPSICERWPEDGSVVNETEDKKRRMSSSLRVYRELKPNILLIANRVIWNLGRRICNKIRREENIQPRDGPLSPQELRYADDHWMREGQKSFRDSFTKGKFKQFSP